MVAIPSQSPKWTQPRLVPTPDAQVRQALLEHDIEECQESEPRWDAAWNHAAATKNLVDLDRRRYYQAEALTMIMINRESAGHHPSCLRNSYGKVSPSHP